MEIKSNDTFNSYKVISPLYNVIDPEIGLNIVDLGLIYEVNFLANENILQIIMTLTTQFCPMGESITNNVLQVAKAAMPDWEVDVQLVFVPAWDFEKISEEGRKFLNV